MASGQRFLTLGHILLGHIVPNIPPSRSQEQLKRDHTYFNSMKNIFLAVFVVCISTTPINVSVPKKVQKIVPHLISRPTGGLRAFMKQMGRIEGGQYSVIGGYKDKYLGMYQFHPATLRSLGIDVAPEEFLNNPTLQDSAMVLYMKDNAKDLRKVIKDFNNKYVDGIFITKSGILAGAHLVGSGGVLSFFYPEKFSYRIVDGNGVHVSTYIQKFANYNLGGL